MHVKMLKYYKIVLLKKCGPQILLCLFFVLTHYVETIKYLVCNRYVQLTRWPSSNAPDCSAIGPVRLPALTMLLRLLFVLLLL